MAAQIVASLGYAVRVASAMTIAGAGVAKLRTQGRFLKIVSEYRILPERMEPVVAALLPPVEILLGIVLLLDLGSPVPAILAAALLLIFAAAIAINLLRGRTTIDCGCSLARGGQPIQPALIVRNLAIAAALLGAALAPFPQSMPIIAIAACAGAVLFTLLLVLNQVVALAGRRFATHR
jgi:hypothetical protein